MIDRDEDFESWLYDFRRDDQRADRAWVAENSEPSRIRAPGYERRLARRRKARAKQIRRRIERRFAQSMH